MAIAAERLRLWRAANPEKVKLQRQRHWQRVKSNPEKLLAKNRRGKKWHHRTKGMRREKLLERSRNGYKQDPAYWRQYALRKRFQLTTAEYDKMFHAQNGVCAICKKKEVDRSKLGKLKWLSVDHCHKTGMIRGLLCRKCNAAIGMMDESAALMTRAAEYLQAKGNGG